MKRRRPLGRLAVVPACAAALVSAAPVAAAPADLDPAFGAGGIARVALDGSAATAPGLAVTQSGGVVVAGGVTSGGGDRLALVALDAAGRLRAGFGSGGIVIRDEASEARAVVLPAGGGAVAAGVRAVSRDRPEGAVLAVDGAGALRWLDAGAFPVAGVIALTGLPDGRLVAAGFGGPELEPAGQLRRLLPDGRPDAAFGDGGTASFASQRGAGQGFEAAVARPDGGVVAAGTTVETAGDERVAGFLLASVDAAGRLDRTFGADGTVRSYPGGDATALDLVRRPDGRLVAVGVARPQGDADWSLVSLLPDGAPDPDFGDAGMVVTQLGAGDDVATAAAVDAAGRVAVAGSTSQTAGESALAVSRYLPDGSIDPDFGTGGVLELDLGPGRDLPGDVAIDQQGRIVVSAAVERVPAVAVVRLTGDGVAGVPSAPAPAGGAVRGGRDRLGARPPAGRYALRLLSRRIGRDGVVRLRASWPAGPRTRLRVRLTRPGRPRETLGTRTFTPRRATRAQVLRVRLTPRGRRLLRRAGRLALAGSLGPVSG